MTDIINLNSIRSDNCDCNKPKPKEHSCGCHNHKPQPCYQAVDLSDQYFKVKNLFGELKSEWQRAEARSNLGIIDILGLEQTDTSQESGGTNEWTMTTQKGGVTSVYKFYVKNGQRGETGPQGKSAYDIYCETTTDYPVKTLAQWLNSLKGEVGDTGPAGKSAYDIYCENTSDYPVKNEQQWLISLKGEPGAPGDPGDMFKVASVSMVSCEEITQGIPLPNGSTYYGKVFNWQIKLNNGEFFNFWAPYGTSGSGNGNNEEGGGDNQQEYRYNVLLFKNYTFGTTSPTTSDFNSAMSTMQASLGSYNTVQQLKDYAGWSEVSPAITNPGYEYTYMGSCVVVNGEIQSRTVIRLTGNTGASGSSTSGGQGQFTSIVFTRSNYDLSSLTITGGRYGQPIPDNNIIYVNGSPRTIIWNDGIPEGSEKIWASSCIFYDDNNKGNWTQPRLMSDTTTYDVEFAGKYTEQDTTPPPPVKWEDATQNNPCNSWRPSGATNNTVAQIWFDPQKDASTDFTKMYWRAERECKNGEWSNWVIVRIKGEKGADGTGGDGPGQQGEQGEQGLMGPVIRMSAYTQGTCYVNESQKPLGENEPITTVHYIDVVYYVPEGATSGTYWMPNPNTRGNCVQGPPSLNNGWIQAEGFDFAFIETLIANHISSFTVDTSEVRIHTNPGNATNDQIVAGMTSGKKVNGTPNVNVGSDDPVRIWAGTNTSVSDTTMDLTAAPFRVTQNGNLYAEKADIEGIIQANTLRLGKLNPSHEGTFVCPEDTNGITLPKLASNKIQMFYILTNHSNITSNITVTAQGTDNIQYTNGTTTIKDSTFPAKPNKLYQLFGVSNGTSEVWYVVEQDLAAATVIINPEEDTNFCGIESIIIITNDEWTKPNDQVDEYILQSQNIKGSVHVFFKNETSAQKTINADDIKVRIKYEAQAIELDPEMLMIPSQLANQVSYELTLHQLSSQVSSNGSKVLTYEYIGNNTYNDSSTVAITNVSYNGTSNANNATYNGKPDIGVVTVTPSTINKNIKSTEDGDTKITLTNIPVTV